MLLILTTCAFLASCSSGGAPDTGPGSSNAAAAPVDLTNERIQTELGSPPFAPVNWQRNVGPFIALGDDQLPDPAQVALMTAAAADIPSQLDIAPRALVRTSSFQTDPNAPIAHAVAAALGPDIYLLDPVFALDGGTTRLNLTYALVHELVHVDQWFDLDPSYVAAARAGEVTEVVLADGSTAVRAFAEATGWEDRDADPMASDWVLSGDGVASSPYGATSPVEDMAETVAWAAVGRTDWLDPARLSWLESWTGASAETFSSGKPWSPAGSQEVLSASPVYDEIRVAELAAASGTHAEPTYFELPATIADPDSVAAEVTRRLTGRGMSGALTRSDDDRLPRYSGTFSRADGTLFWVEFWDFRDADLGPELPILTYVLIW